MPNTCCHIYYYRSDGSFIQFVVQPNRDLLFTHSSTIVPLSTSTSHHPVACFVDPKYLNELVRGIRFPAKHVGLKHYVLFLLIYSCRSTSNLNYCHAFPLLSLSAGVFPSASLT